MAISQSGIHSCRFRTLEFCTFWCPASTIPCFLWQPSICETNNNSWMRSLYWPFHGAFSHADLWDQSLNDVTVSKLVKKREATALMTARHLLHADSCADLRVYQCQPILWRRMFAMMLVLRTVRTWSRIILLCATIWYLPWWLLQYHYDAGINLTLRCAFTDKPKPRCIIRHAYHLKGCCAFCLLTRCSLTYSNIPNQFWIFPHCFLKPFIRFQLAGPSESQEPGGRANWQRVLRGERGRGCV